ncbi:MAG: hypothetical protein ACREOJ_21005 [Gemmatimonadaceae bacterium]
MYPRNPYYHLATGHLTREDPLGLAGGLDVHGFNGADPLSYSDPCGSGRPCTLEELLQVGTGLHTTDHAVGSDHGGRKSYRDVSLTA